VLWPELAPVEANPDIKRSIFSDPHLEQITPFSLYEN
jgi:hypothetical protein